MIPSSKTFKDALVTSHKAETRVKVLQPQTDRTYLEVATVAVVDGSLTIDGRRNIWRQGSLSLVPQDVYSDPLVELINETTRLQIERGVTAPNLVTEWVTIAVVQVTGISQSLSSAAVTVQFMDAALALQEFPLTRPWSPLDDQGEKLTSVQAIQHLVEEALWDSPTWVVGDDVSSTQTPPEGTVFQGARSTAVNELAKGLGAFVHVRHDGAWEICKSPSGTDPVASFLTGVNGVLISEEMNRTRQETFNAVPLRWESPEGGGLVFLVDSDPDSPTYWNGPFGRKPANEQRVDTVTTQEEAIEAAAALLDDFKGFTSVVRFQSVHNPLIEPYDRIEVDVLGSREVHVVDTLTLPLSGGQMSCETRKLVVSDA